MPDKLQGWLETIGFFAMMTNIRKSDPQWKFWKFRFVDGFLISVVSGLIVAVSVVYFSDSFVSRNDTIEATMKHELGEIKTILKSNQLYNNDRLDKLYEGHNNLDRRLFKMENIIYGTEVWDAED